MIGRAHGHCANPRSPVSKGGSAPLTLYTGFDAPIFPNFRMDRVFSPLRLSKANKELYCRCRLWLLSLKPTNNTHFLVVNETTNQFARCRLHTHKVICFAWQSSKFKCAVFRLFTIISQTDSSCQTKGECTRCNFTKSLEFVCFQDYFSSCDFQ